jgi:2-amino-4-hydroxy-6-hydroxymethyldihydropteridine diphosphokinase
VIYLALGASIPSIAGSPQDTLHATIAMLQGDEICVLSVSRFYETPAWPNPADPPFINAVLKIRTELTPAQLLMHIHSVEAHFGRTRIARNAPRTLDIDIVDYNGRIEDGPPALPHPRAESRNFVLIPLRDVAPDWHHPLSGRSVDELIAALPEAERTLTAL